MRERSAPAASRSWTSTSTTATARSTSSSAIRRSCTSRRTSIRTTRAPAPPTKSAWATARASRSTCRSSPAAVDADYQLAFDEVIVPVLRQFKPDVLLVSAGFDAHERDPLATMRVTAEGFGAMTAALRGVAEETCARTDGARHRRRLRSSGAGGVDRSDGGARWRRPGFPNPRGPPLQPSRRQHRAAAAAATLVKRAIAPFWKVK